MLIQQRGPYCQRCERLVTNTVELIGHHKVQLTPENVHDHSISLNPELVDIICRDCHDEEHMRFGYENNSRGVYLVYGPPLAGKTTYVMQNKTRMDIVVDMNLLFSSIAMLPEFDKPDALFPMIRSVQHLLTDNIRTRFGKWSNAWIVGGYADRYSRNRIVKDLGAEPIFIDVSLDECLSRLRLDERLQYRQQ